MTGGVVPRGWMVGVWVASAAGEGVLPPGPGATRVGCPAGAVVGVGPVGPPGRQAAVTLARRDINAKQAAACKQRRDTHLLNDVPAPMLQGHADRDPRARGATAGGPARCAVSWPNRRGRNKEVKRHMDVVGIFLFYSTRRRHERLGSACCEATRGPEG